MQIQLPDLSTTRRAIRAGLTSAHEEMDRAIGVSASDSCKNALLKTFGESARTQTRDSSLANRCLAGLAVSVKDLFDVQDQVTTAGSIVLSDAAPARQDCPAVARLKSAGGVLIGRTNMSEFAFSGVGTNPHYGTPANAAATDVPRIPGGSSSGASTSSGRAMASSTAPAIWPRSRRNTASPTSMPMWGSCSRKAWWPNRASPRR